MKKLLLIGLATLTLSFTGETIKEASFYHDKYHNRKSADGSIFRQDKLTAATNTIPLGTKVRVINTKNGKSVVVKITDRTHKNYSHRIDLSKRAFKEIAELRAGIVPVKIEQL